MLFRTLSKTEFRKLVERVLETNEVIGPKAVGTDAEGRPIHQLLPIEGFEQLDLAYEKALYSAKTYFLPYRENLSSFRFQDDDWKQELRYRIQPRAIIGLHACDINALVKLDKVFAKDFFPSPYYVSRRKNTFLIGFDHETCRDGFCRSLGTGEVERGCDLFLTDLGDRYFVAIDSDRGYSLLRLVETKEIEDADTQAYLAARKHILSGPQVEVRMHNLPNLLDIEFESDVWRKWGEKCLGCGSCAMVCPTCYCYGVSERVSMAFDESRKVKQLYSCNLVDFAEVAGGHNFRPDRQTRLKYRYYHQHRGFVEAYDEAKCVGCNRCGRVCLAGINPVDVIRDLQAEDQS